MCVRRKKSNESSGKENVKTKSLKSTTGETPTSTTPVKQSGTLTEKPKEKSKEKDREKEVDAGENIFAKPVSSLAPLKDEKEKEPLHIKVPPPRILKAKRPMKEVRSARDPQYKTLELDMSEWESVKIMKRSEINLEEIQRRDFKTLQATQQ